MILGILWSRQPCSSYVVMTRFKKSPTWGWSSSSGAIYPAISRLKGRGLVAAEASPAAGARSKLLSLTPDGEEALKRWIGDLTEDMGSAGIDPIRTRVNYLPAMSPAERAAFLDRAQAVTRSRLELARQSRGDPQARQSWSLEATTSALVHQLEARLRWLGELRYLIEQHAES